MSGGFSGLSSLRAKEQKDAGPQPPSDRAKQLASYLAQQYGAGPAADKAKKKKKKVKRQEGAAVGAVRVVDVDVSGFVDPYAAEEEKQQKRDKEEEIDEDQPVIANAEEAEWLRQQVQYERELKESGGGGAWAEVEEEINGGAAAAAAGRFAGRHDSSEDASPPRRRPRNDSPDASPLRRGRAVRAGSSSPDASPPRRRARHDSPKDSSPLRRRARHDSPEFSPPRRARHDSPKDSSPPRRMRHDSPGDASPPRRGAQQAPCGSSSGGSDASPPRRSRAQQRGDSPGGGSDASPPRRSATAAAGGADDKKKALMSDGAVAGMVSGREVMAEMARKREAEAQRFAALGAEVTGRGAATVYRSKDGQKLTQAEYLEAKKAERAAGKAQYDDESQLEWGGGLQQRREREELQQRMAEEAALPFARGHDDRLDAEQRERMRWGDPMAHLVKKKAPVFDAPAALAGANLDAMKKSGFVIPLEVPQHSWLRRGVGQPLNRYSIKPGRHWDGVDRSNGFERDMVKRQTELLRREQQARRDNQGDM